MKYKTSVINFESHFIPMEQRYDLIMQDVTQAVNCGSDTVIGLLLADGFLYSDSEFFELLNKVKNRSEQLGIKNLFLLPGMVQDVNVTGYSVIKNFDYNLHMAYQSYAPRKKLLKPWNTNSSKFLFLGGVPDRPNRIILLNKFYKANMLKDSVWSFFKPWTSEQESWCRQALIEYNDKEYNDFINYCESRIDNLYNDNKEYGLPGYTYDNEWFSDPAWISPDIFSNTMLSVISEGYPLDAKQSSKFLTEKTWRVFAQRHPFILVANKEMIQYAESLDFEIFRSSDDLDKVVSYTQDFLKLYKDNMPLINTMVEYNYNLFFQLGSANDSNLKSIKEHYNITDSDFDLWFNKKGFSHLIKETNV